MRITMREESNKPLRKSKLPEQVFDQLMEWIMTGELPMGSRLTTDDLAEKLGVSRMPVREALAGLEVIGLAETVPYAGTRLVKLTRDDVREIYLARSVLEPLAAKYACMNMTPEAFARISEIHERYKKAVRREDMDPLEIYDLNREFHFAIYKESGLRRICEDIEKYWDNLSYFKAIYGQKLLQNNELKESMIQEHQSYVDALRNHDCESLFEAQKANLEKRVADIEFYTDGYFDENDA